jgi:hypothetical protein
MNNLKVNVCMTNLIEDVLLPENFQYPKAFLAVVAQQLLDLDPWSVMTGDNLRSRYNGLKHRYPNRILVPFARRLDNDDLACWDIDNEGSIVIIHDFASAGWEQRNKTRYVSFWDWFKVAIDDMIAYNNEDIAD